MKKLLSAILVSFSLVVLPNSSQAVDLSVSIGASTAQGGYHATGTETINATNGEYNTAAVTEEAGVFEDSHQALFGELNIGDNMTIGAEFALNDLQTPSNTNVQCDKTTTKTCSNSTNTAQASFSDRVTVYVQARMLGGLYTKIMYHNVNVISEESLSTGGAYGDQTIEGLGMGLGYQYDIEDYGLFIRAEVTASAYENVKAVNTNDVNKVITITDMYGAEGSIKVGKTF